MSGSAIADHDRDAAVGRPAPRYSRLARALVADIEAGRYAIGTQLPTEAALCERFGVSRHTVRQALRELKDLGIVSAHPGVGTWVRARPKPPRFVHGASSIEDLLQVSKETRLELLEQQEVIADAELAAFLKCGVAQAWLRLSVLRFYPGSDLPLAHLIVYIRPEFADVIRHIGKSHEPIFVLVERLHRLRPTEIRQEISPVKISEAAAELLITPPGEPALQVVRHFFDERDSVMQVAIGLYPAGRFSHITTFRLARSPDDATAQQQTAKDLRKARAP